MAKVYNRIANIEAAKVVSRSGHTRAAAERVAAKAAALAAAHTETGELASHFTVTSATGGNGVTDWLVSNDDPLIGAIEFGHKTRHGGYSEGLFIMTRAAH